MNLIQWIPSFTSRELQILELVALGFSAKEIAQKRAVAHRTVETQLDTMRLKLGARNRTHMVAIAIVSKLLFRTEQSPVDEPEAAPVDFDRTGTKSPAWFVGAD